MLLKPNKERSKQNQSWLIFIIVNPISFICCDDDDDDDGDYITIRDKANT